MRSVTLSIDERTSLASSDDELRPHLAIDRELWVVLLYVAVALMGANYFGQGHSFRSFFPGLRHSLPAPLFELISLLWFTGSRILLWLLIPMLILRLLGRNPADYGLRLPRLSKHLWIYPIFYLLMCPLLLAASRMPAFLRVYPFYHSAAKFPLYWVAFEVAYALSFLGVEFLFRGFLLRMLHRRIGDLAVLVTMIPYCMLHLQKPILECAGSIVAGIVLGFLALRTRSVLGGALLHSAIAVSMDVLALALTKH